MTYRCAVLEIEEKKEVKRIGLNKVTLRSNLEAITTVVIDEETYEFLGMADNLGNAFPLIWNSASYGSVVNTNAIQKNIEDFVFEYCPDNVGSIHIKKQVKDGMITWFCHIKTPTNQPLFQVLVFAKEK